MEILVIKQTSLGDVLHSTGHVRAIREQFPHARITLLTAVTSADIYLHNPHVDQIIHFDRYGVKRDWYRHPVRVLRHIGDVMTEVRSRSYDLALDLQGRWKSVLFLYGARARQRYVKGRWIGACRFHDRDLHALDEMRELLRCAGIRVAATDMEIFTSESEKSAIDDMVARINPSGVPMIVLSPFTRWPGKNWPLEHYDGLLRRLPAGVLAVVTGSGVEAPAIDAWLEERSHPNAVSVAGQLSLLEFAELVRRVEAVVTGDSFPMHVAAAQRVPVIAMFGPTDERRVGPRGDRAVIVRAPDCARCYRRARCPRNCLARITPDRVMQHLASILESGTKGNRITPAGAPAS